MTNLNRLLLPLSMTIIVLATSCVSSGAERNMSAHASAQPDSAIWLSGKTWLLAGYYTGSQFVPLEPGQSSSARIVFSRDGNLSGSTGFNTFSGHWILKNNNATNATPFTLTITEQTHAGAPNEIAVRFEQDLLRQLAASKALKKGKDSIQLLDGQNRILVQFIFRESGNQF